MGRCHDRVLINMPIRAEYRSRLIRELQTKELFDVVALSKRSKMKHDGRRYLTTKLRFPRFFRGA